MLAVDEKYVSKTFQKQIADKNTELNLDDAVKITGCWNGLAKRFESAASTTADLARRRCADASGRRILALDQGLKAFVEKFGQIVAAFTAKRIPTRTGLLEIRATTSTAPSTPLRRGALLDWLKAESPDNTCRILSNARCLSEGVDVPALDAVLFLNPRNSVIDVVQSVGRVMRKHTGQALRLHHVAGRHPRRHEARRRAQGQREIQGRLAGAPGAPRPRRPFQRHHQSTGTQ